MVTTNSKELYKKLTLLRSHGITKNDMEQNHSGWYYEMQTFFKHTGENVLLVISSQPSIDAQKDIAKGEVFSAENIKVIRPGDGLHPRYYENMIGNISDRAFEKANVRWFLSINYATLPEEIKAEGMRTYRSITIDGEEIEFSRGLTELHTRSYEDILNGGGFPMSESRQAIETVYKIRHAEPVGKVGEYHPFCEKEQGKHPFKR